MASWNDKNLGDKLDKCPVCLCNLNKKKMTTHVSDCYERNKAQMDALGIIRCPMSSEHILPLCFLNHHLEGNCQEVQNQLRTYLQGAESMRGFNGAPPDYNPGFPDEYLNKHNKDMLYLLHNKLFANFLKDRPHDHTPEERRAITGPSAQHSRANITSGNDDDID